MVGFYQLLYFLFQFPVPADKFGNPRHQILRAPAVIQHAQHQADDKKDYHRGKGHRQYEGECFHFFPNFLLQTLDLQRSFQFQGLYNKSSKFMPIKKV